MLFLLLSVDAADDANAGGKMSKEAVETTPVEQTATATEADAEQKSNNLETSGSEQQANTKTELELQEWVEKNHDFFINKLFPAAQHYEEINQRCFYWL